MATRCRAFVRETSDRRNVEGLAVELVFGDVLQPETIATAASGCDVLFHTAAVYTYHGHTPDELESVAVQGTLNALEAARRSGVRRVVLTSSSSVLGSSIRPVARDEASGCPEGGAPPYIVAKAAQERAAFRRAAELGLEMVAVCPTLTVGPYDYRLGPSNAAIVTYLADPFKLTYPGGCNIVSARDIAAGHVLAAKVGIPGERYVLGADNLEWSDVHRMISELCGMPGPHFTANHTVSFLAAAAQEVAARLTGRSPRVTRLQSKMVGRYYWYRYDRAAALGYAPQPSRRALAEAVAWLVASPHVSRGLRTAIRLSREVYEARNELDREPERERGWPIHENVQECRHREAPAPPGMGDSPGPPP